MTAKTRADQWDAALTNYLTHQHQKRGSGNTRRITVQTEPTPGAHVVVPLAEFCTLNRDRLRGLQ